MFGGTKTVRPPDHIMASTKAHIWACAYMTACTDGADDTVHTRYSSDAKRVSYQLRRMRAMEFEMHRVCV